jgi:hypothetical protein
LAWRRRADKLDDIVATFVAGRPIHHIQRIIIDKYLILWHIFTTRGTNAIIALDPPADAPHQIPSEEKMTEVTDALYDKALGLSDNIPDNFMELGRAFAQLYDLDAELFRQLAAKSNMGLRRAYYLIEVSRTIEALAIPRDQLGKIGWPKLQLVAKHLTPNTLDALLQLAEDMTAKDLERHVRREKPLGNAHCVRRYFSPKQYTQLEGALVPYGAAPGRDAIK